MTIIGVFLVVFFSFFLVIAVGVIGMAMEKEGLTPLVYIALYFAQKHKSRVLVVPKYSVKDRKHRWYLYVKPFKLLPMVCILDKEDKEYRSGNLYSAVKDAIEIEESFFINP